MHHKEKIQQDATMHQNFIIPYLYEAQLHWQPLVFHTWKVVGRVVGGRCQAQSLSACTRVHFTFITVLCVVQNSLCHKQSLQMGEKWLTH